MTGSPIAQGRALIGYAEAARRLGIPLGTLYALVSQRRVPHHRLGPRFVKFDPEALDVWIGDRAIGPTVPKVAKLATTCSSDLVESGAAPSGTLVERGERPTASYRAGGSPRPSVGATVVTVRNRRREP